MLDNASYPNLSVPEHEKTDSWYINAVKYFMGFYNRSALNVTNPNPIDNLGYVDRGLANMKYYIGQQQNINYNHITTDLSGNSLIAPWIPGRKVQSLVNHRLGFLSKQLEEKEVSSTSLSPEVISQKQKLLEDAMIKFDEDFINVQQDIAKLGVVYEPISGKDFSSADELEKYINQNIKDYGETLSTNIARHVEKSNDSNLEYKKVFLDYHAAGVGALFNYVENGDIKQRAIRFWELIWDNLKDDPIKKKMRFGGTVQMMTPNELFSIYEFTEEEKSEIHQIAASAKNNGGEILSEFKNLYNTPYMLNWDYSQGQLLISVVNMYFIADRDLRYKKNEDKYGNEHIERVRRKNKKGDYVTQDLYNVVYIGNKYLKKKGLANNVVRDRDNKTVPQIPIIVFTHNTIMGELIPPISMISQHQDNMDFYRYKITELVSRDNGKNYIIHGDKLEGTTSKSLITDFKSIGIHVTTGNTGESDDPTNSKRFVEYVDLTLDPNVVKYLELYRQEEVIMEKIMSTNQIDLGQQVSYISKGTQQQTIAQTNQGVIDLFHNFIKFNTICLQHCVELAKMVYTINGDTKKLFIIGDRGAKFLDVTKDFKFQDLLIYVNINDVVDEDTKQALRMMLQAWSQNPEYGVLPNDMVKLLSATTYSEMVAIIDSAFRRSERAKQQALAEQRQFEATQKQEELNSQENQTIIRESAANSRADVNAEAKMSESILKHDAQTQPT